MSEPTGNEVFLVTKLTREDGHWYIQMTNENEMGLELGPFALNDGTPESRWYVERIERHLLINWYSWYMLILGSNVMAFDEACRQLVGDCIARDDTQASHDAWMAAHPLPAPTATKLNDQGVSESFQSLMDSLINPPRRDS